MRAEVDMTEVIREIENLGKNARDLSPQMAVVASDIVAEVTRRFQAGNFQVLAKSTLKRKLRAGKSAQPLLYNGGWRNSHEPDFGPDFAATYTDRFYAIFHVSDQARSKIPLRDPYAFDQDFWDEQVEHITQFLLTGKPQ